MKELPAIQVKNLSKSYTISHKNKPKYNTVKDDFSHLIKDPFGKKVNSDETFWALKNISFEVKKGEIFGVIGKNGSGKSTLLKILSRIVDPTEGEIKLNGRVASLLEVGTGFHPDLTGRENVYFNGSMLGMSRKEMSTKFNDIVEFAEIEQFIDTPVKFYSSGMYVRLAFSVAAHLDPEILILDEVLSVGDASFQKKSLEKIKSTMEGGTTVLFVSHGMSSVKQLCSRGILLNSGRIQYLGDTDSIVDLYNDTIRPELQPEKPPKTTWENDGSFGDKFFVPIKTYITDQKNEIVSKPVNNKEDHYFNVELKVIDDSDILTIGYVVHNEHSSVIYVSANTDVPSNVTYRLKKGKQTLTCKIPKNLLNGGKYTVSLFGGRLNKQIWVIEPESRIAAIEFTVDSGKLSESPLWTQPRSGFAAPLLNWDIKSIGEASA